MGKLMKYEIFRRSKLLVIVGLVLVFMEGAAIYGLYRGDEWLVLFFLMMGGMLFAALILPLVDAIANLFSDFKNTHGYMLFLTPSTGFQIIGSKALFTLIELVAGLAVVAGFYTANFYLARTFGYGSAIHIIETILEKIPDIFDAPTGAVISLFTISGILQGFNMIMLAITALTVAKTLLSQKNFNWLIALLLYFVLAAGVQTVNNLLLTALGFLKNIVAYMESDTFGLQAVKFALVNIGLYLLWIAGGYVSSSLLLNKRVDL